MQKLIRQWTPAADQSRRRGAFLVLGFFALIVCLGFVAFSVDIGMISLTRTQMQNSVDAAALAAAMEITNAVQTAPQGTEDITVYARQAAREKAAEVAGLNGVYVDPDLDVIFGQRSYNADTEEFSIDWEIDPSAPANCVKVMARRDNEDTSAQDGKLRLSFAGIFGDNTAELNVAATAYVEARDLVVVHDFSRSMNFDSYYSDETLSATLSDEQIESNTYDTWLDLQPLNVGTMTFEPQYLTMSRSDPNITVTFQYNTLHATTTDDMKSCKLRYTNDSEQTITVAANASEKKNITFQGTNSNATRNIKKVWITVSVPHEETVSGGAVSQSGTPNVTATFATTKKSVGIQSSHSLQKVELKFTDNSTQQIDFTGTSGTFSGTSGNWGKLLSAVRVRYNWTWKNWLNIPADTTQTVYEDETYSFEDTDSNVVASFGLNNVTYPYPSGSWTDFVDFVRDSDILDDKGYCEKYGGLTFVNYILRQKSSYSQTPALATARHYPFHAIKQGHVLMCDFLEDLGFDDHLGMVSYDTQHRIETTMSGDGLPTVNISAAPLGTNYDAVANLMLYKQANHYFPSTNISGGMVSAIALLDEHKRSGARQNILLMTDGNANVTEGSTTLPGDYQSWFTGYDGAGTSYDVTYGGASSSIINARSALLNQVHAAVGKEYVIHTIAVGADADWKTMKAIAHYSGGEYIRVEGGTTTEELEAQLLAAFHKIAGLVPPAKLLGPSAE
jgi:hypothetical protein